MTESAAAVSGRVVVLAGPPGAGKSTVARRIAARHKRAVHLHTDDFWSYIVTGAIPPYQPASDAQNQTVLSVIAGATFTYASGGFVTVVDGVVGPWMLHHFRTAMTTAPHTRADYIVLRPRRKITLARAMARTEPGALVDHNPLGLMWDQFADLGPMEPHVIDTSEESIEETTERVSALLDGDTHRLRAA
ncbi:AAA family ATPase [Streptomyces daliensis]|uniref:AAA family ATPase n=1 Tax=Streptomyces daliensis TaxID=299421 RepID=A0A8T4IY74_9ACTN|nr:AAA family ATPase [Streptomyces daliensis]